MYDSFFVYAALVLDGKALAQKTEQELAARVAALKARSNGQTPILATILVGDDPASATYVKMKGNAWYLEEDQLVEYLNLWGGSEREGINKGG